MFLTQLFEEDNKIATASYRIHESDRLRDLKNTGNFVEIAKLCSSVEEFIKKTDGMNVLYRGHLNDHTGDNSFMTDYVSHAEEYADGGRIDAFAYNPADVLFYDDRRFDEMRNAYKGLSDKQFASIYQNAGDHAVFVIKDSKMRDRIKKMLRSNTPYSEFCSNYEDNDLFIPLLQKYALAHGKNIIAFHGGDYREYGGQTEYVVSSISKLTDLRQIYAKAKQTPVSESSLPMDTASRMKRAQELGFTVRAYHGTGQKFNEFDLDKGHPNPISGYAPHFSISKKEAQGYADEANDERFKAKRSDGSGDVRVLDCLLRIRNPYIASYDNAISVEEYEKIVGRLPIRDRFAEVKEIDTSELNTFRALTQLGTIFGYERDQYKDRRMQWTLTYKRLIDLGYDAIYFPGTPADNSRDDYTKIVVFDPKNIRSVKAKFDPAQSESRNLLA